MKNRHTQLRHRSLVWRRKGTSAGKRTGHHALVLLALGLITSVASGQEREDVQFQITHDTGNPAISVFVLGNLPELGGGDLTRAVKLVAKEAFLWQVTISLPVNRTYTYQYYARAHGANFIGNPDNGIPISEEFTDSTSTVQLSPIAKKMYYHSTFDPPTLHWRQDDGLYETLVMQEIGPGREPGELRWLACGFGEARRPIEFYLTNADETLRDPADPAETYLTPLDAFFLQDSHLFTYVPDPMVTPQQRAYDPRNPPSIPAPTLPEGTRLYRVMLPRGYNDHPNRHYPVAYFHDGRNVWDPILDDPLPPVCNFLAPCAHDLDGATAAELTRLGQMREIIGVAIDVPGKGCERRQNRVRDYVPPGDTVSQCNVPVNGEANIYVDFIINELKPHIDANYRTLTDPEHTGTAGFSLGGIISMHLGWDFPEFTRAGLQSPSFHLATNFRDRVETEPWREIRIYMDGGTLEFSYPVNLAVRDNLLSKTPEHWVVEGDHRYFVGFGQSHTIQESGSRFPQMLTFLFPGTEEPNELLCPADLDCDNEVGVIELLDLLGQWGTDPGGPPDFDNDGDVGVTDLLKLLAQWGPCN